MTEKSDLPKMDARRLAWCAEGADGERDTDLVLYTDGREVLLGTANATNMATAICLVHTKSRKPKLESNPLLKIPDKGDACFLTESAVEKFLFPYYEAQRLFQPGELERLKKKFYSNDNYVGIWHIFPSRPLFLCRDGTTVEFPVKTVVQLPLE